MVGRFITTSARASARCGTFVNKPTRAPESTKTAIVLKMNTPLPRRDALKSLGLAAVSTLAAATALAADKSPAKSAPPMKDSEIGFKDGKYVLPPLPYAHEALEPAIDKETMMLHHDKHHLAYVNGANKAVDGLKAIAAGTGDAAMLPLFNNDLSFNLSGHVLHTTFWNNMKAGGSKPAGALLDAMKESFGSAEAFEKLFAATAGAVQGSGWAILGYSPISGRLATVGAEKHNNSAIQGLEPLLVCDVWEHAYYLKYHNVRADYVKAFLTVVNYEDVAARLAKVMA